MLGVLVALGPGFGLGRAGVASGLGVAGASWAGGVGWGLVGAALGQGGGAEVAFRFRLGLELGLEGGFGLPSAILSFNNKNEKSTKVPGIPQDISQESFEESFQENSQETPQEASQESSLA